MAIPTWWQACSPPRATTPWQRIKQVRSHHGATSGLFEAWLLLRGLRTLEVRVHAQTETAATLATRFANHQSISSVLYPGLPTHPGHAVAARQMCGFGGCSRCA